MHVQPHQPSSRLTARSTPRRGASLATLTASLTSWVLPAMKGTRWATGGTAAGRGPAIVLGDGGQYHRQMAHGGADGGVVDHCIWGGHSWTREHQKVRVGGGNHFVWQGERWTARPVDGETFSRLEEAHGAFCGPAESSLRRMQERHREMRMLGPRMADEMDVFLLKRLVPGRCRYCPA